MSTAAGELRTNNSTAATSDHIIYPYWAPAGNQEDLWELKTAKEFIIWGAPDPPPEKPKRKSKWLLKQMSRRGHR